MRFKAISGSREACTTTPEDHLRLQILQAKKARGDYSMSLTEQLATVRSENEGLHAQNLALIEEIREADLKIKKLKDRLRTMRYETIKVVYEEFKARGGFEFQTKTTEDWNTIIDVISDIEAVE